jgi:hypothetical protein
MNMNSRPAVAPPEPDPDPQQALMALMLRRHPEPVG